MATYKESKKIVLTNIPSSYDAELVKDYIEGTLDIDTIEVNIYPYIPGRALVTTKEDLKDFSDAAQLVAESPIEGSEVQLLDTHRKPAIVINELNIDKLSECFLKLYLENTFADGEEVIQSCQTWPDYHLATVHFSSQHENVVDEILNETDHIPLPSEDYHIKISHFYSNFHEYIGQQTNENTTSVKSIVKAFDHVHCKNDNPSPINTDARDSKDMSEEDDEDNMEGDKIEDSETDDHTGSEGDGNDSENDDGKDNSAGYKKDQNSVTKTNFRGRGFRGGGSFMTRGVSNAASRSQHVFHQVRDDDSEDNDNDYEGDHGSGNSSGYKKEPNLKTKTKFRGRGFRGGNLMTRGMNKNATSRPEDGFHKEKEPDSDNSPIFSMSGRGRGNFRGKMGQSGSQMGYRNKAHISPGDMITDTFSRGLGNSRGRQSRKDVNFHSENRGRSNNSSKERKHSISGNEFSGKSLNRMEAQRPLRHSFSRDSFEDDYDQPRHLGSHPKAEPMSNSQPYLGCGHTYIPSGTRGGRSGSTFIWDNAGQQKFSKFDNKLNLQEERIRFDNDEMASKEPRGLDISKPFVSGNPIKLDSSQEASEEKNKQLQNELDKEKAKFQEAKPTKSTLETTLLQLEFLKTSFSDFNDCMIQIDAQNKALILYGPESVIRECQLKLMLEMKKIKEETITISSDMKSILSREKGKKYLEDLNSSGLKVAVDDLTLLLAAKEEISLSEAFKMLKCKLDFVESVKCEVVIPHDRLISLKYHIENGLLVHVTFDDNGKIIKLLGIEDDVLMARRDVEKLLEEFGVYEKSFNVEEPEARFLHLCCEDKISSCLKSVDVTELTSTETKVSIRFKGNKAETSQVQRNLKDLKNNILSKTWILSGDFKKHELFLLSKSLNSGAMKEKLETYKYREKILVIPKFPNFTTKLPLASKKKNTPDKTNRPKSRARDSRPVPHVQSPKLISGDKLVYDISNTCQLIIKSYGDIIREKSDILVSILGPEIDMRKTMVGRIFNKTYTSHWKELQTVKEGNPNSPVLTVKNPKGLKCMAVCHVVLSKWNPNSSQQLNVAIQTVLNEAKSLGAKSISFPALGCGRAFQFPPLNEAQQVLASIRAMNVGTFLNKVVLLALDKELFKALKSEVPKHFNAASPKNKPAPPLPPPPAPPAPTVAKEESDEETDDSESSDDGLEVSNLNDTKDSKAPQFTIITLHGNKTFEAIKIMITHDIQELCLHVDYFNQNIINHWPKESRQKILTEAMKLSVWAERSIHPKTKRVGFQLTGEKAAVIQIKAFIHQEFLEESSHLPKRSLTSDQVPRRGTVDFMRYAADSDELFPSYWSLNKSKTFWKDLRNKFSNKQKKLLLDVDKETKDAITNLVTQTLDKGLVGQGTDAVGIQYSSLKVLDIKRVENPEMFELYRVQRKRLFEKMVRRGHICPDIGKLRSSKGRVCTTELLSDSMKKELYYEINEHYLFHGTKSDTIDALIHNGLDPRLSNEAAMFGKGIYAAERVTKSDQYTDSKQQRTHPGTKLTLILTRMLLGNVFLCDNNHKSVQGKGSKKLSRPPCMSCSEDVCKCRDQTLFDSVMGDGKWLFREFVVYESSQCYPEYVITYTRV